MNAGIGVIGTTLGVLIGGILFWLNFRLQFRSQEMKDRKKLLLTKIEEIGFVA